MINFYIAVEDDLSAVVAETILRAEGCTVERRLPERSRLGFAPGVDHLKIKINGYNAIARNRPFLMLVDLDRSECAPSLIETWVRHPLHRTFLLRVAVREIESWIMADRKGFSDFLQVPLHRLPGSPDSLDDPKLKLIEIAKKSKIKLIRTSIVPALGTNAKIGPDYYAALIQFVIRYWDIGNAAAHSDSLHRALAAIRRCVSEFNRLSSQFGS